MLSRFRRPAADFRVELSETTLQPGDELNVRVSLIPKDGFQVRRGSLDLVCLETYEELIHHSRYGAQRHKATQVLSRDEKVFIDGTAVRRGLPYYADVNVVVPPDALPTVRGAIMRSIDVGITWTVTTSLDVAGARDFHDNQQITVVRPPMPSDAPSSPIVTEAAHNWCALTLNLPTGSACSGDRLDGSLRAEILQDVSVSEVSVELFRVEAFGSAVQDYTEDIMTLDTDLELRRGETREWPIRISVGEVFTPSLQTRNSSIRWLVKCVLARRMRFDAQIEQEIRVDV